MRAYQQPEPNDDLAHTAANMMIRSRRLEDFVEIEMRDGTRLWVSPGQGFSFPDASASDELISVRAKIRDLEREVNELHGPLGHTVRNLPPG